MFQSVIQQQQSGRFGAGASVSVLVHAGLVAAVLFLSRGVVEAEPEPVRPNPVLTLVRQPPRGNPTPAPTQTVAQPQPRPKPKKFVQSPVIAPLPPPEAMPPPPAPVDTFVSNLPVVPNSHPDGVDTDSAPTDKPGDGPTNISILEPAEEGTAVFRDEDMQAPKLLSGAAIQYTREALEARVQGMLVAKCVITREGDVEDCKISQGLPHMETAVLSALETRRYSPVIWQNKPIRVSYTFKIRLNMPR